MKNALPKEVEWSIKLRTGGNRSRRLNPKSQRRNPQMRLLRARRKEKTMHTSRLAPDFVPLDDEDFTSFVITSGHNHEAYGVSSSTDLIVDCGASSHFSPDKFKFVNFEAIPPEPIRAADGHTFSAIGCGDLVVNLPVKNGENGPPITLKRVYYAPKMAFTLVSVACLDKAGCSLTIEDGECQIRSPRPYRTILGSVPRVNNLYRLDSSAIQGPEPPKHYANVASGPISISDVQFNAYIRTSLSLTTRYQPLLTTLSIMAQQTKTALTSDNLIWHLVKEAN